MQVEIDKKSGFCFGVVYAIEAAEAQLEKYGKLYCLGDIVHNEEEVERLRRKGLVTIDHQQFAQLRNERVLIRAHGEPPSTYQMAIANGIELIDASCPVVLKLQNRVKKGYDKASEQNGQVVIFGKKGHAEVTGMLGQVNNNALVVTEMDDLDAIDYTRPVSLYSQTTKPKQKLAKIHLEIKRRAEELLGPGNAQIEFNDTTCRQVSNREPELRTFARQHDVVLFVSGKKSSNGITLHGVCQQENPRSYFVSSWDEVDLSWIGPNDTVGICGATSTPLWLMEHVRDQLLAARQNTAQDQA